MSYNFIDLHTKKKYSFTDEKVDTFFKKYSQCMFRQNCCFYEVPREMSAFWVDLDIDQGSINRKYTQEDVKKIIKVFNSFLIEVSTKSALDCFVLEKPLPELKGKRFKDGLHLIYPFIKMSKDDKKKLIEDAVKIFINQKDLRHIPGKEPWTRTVDKMSATSINMLLGSHKAKGKPFYNLTHVYNFEGEDIISNYDDLENWELAKIMSLNYGDKIVIGQDNNIKVELLCDENGKVDLMKLTEKNRIKFAKAFLPLLKDERTQYYDDWLYVGFALKNTSKELKDEWIDFSKRCPSKYNDLECKRVWQNAKSDGKGLTLNDLSSWAEEDNPTGWGLLLEDE